MICISPPTPFVRKSGDAMSGDLNMGAHNITGVGTVDGVDVSAHAANVANPHTVTKTQVGLSAVVNKEQVAKDGTIAMTGNLTFTGAQTVDGRDISADVLSAYTDKDLDENVLLKAHAYKAPCDGIASVWINLAAGQAWVKGYVGLTNDPEGAGFLIKHLTQDTEGQGYKVGFDLQVAKNEYFEITTSDDIPVIRWKCWGAMNKPVDYD